MDTEIFFQEVEKLIEKYKGKELENHFKVTIYYSTGERDVFEESILFWANALASSKRRDKYLYTNNTLISLDHVVKIKFDKLNTEDEAPA